MELESELENRNNEYCEVLQMDQADREEFSIQTKANLDLAKEKDVSSTRVANPLVKTTKNWWWQNFDHFMIAIEPSFKYIF